MNTGKSLRIALIRKSMKQHQLAEKLNVTSQVVSNWTRRTSMKESTINKICECLEMKVSEFIALGEE